MKKILIAALALSLLGGAAATAKDGGRHERGRDHYERSQERGDWRDYRGDDRGARHFEGRRYDDRRSTGHRWQRGQRLPPAYWGYGVDYRGSHLRRPPYGYRWVRVGDDYVLTSAATGLILEVISGGY